MDGRGEGVQPITSGRYCLDAVPSSRGTGPVDVEDVNDV